MSVIQDVWQKEVERKLDRLLNDMDFVKSRVSSYLGRNESLTYLKDETPIFVNTDDFGCPLNFLNGGLYEEEEWGIFLSYRAPNSIVLDVGANLGVYSLRMAPYVRGGQIHAFEPTDRIRNLFSRSVFLNGYGHIVSINSCAISDFNGEANFTLPEGHAGGASLEGGDGSGGVVQVRTLDTVLPQGTRVDMMKLDVEGHELKALTGMMPVLKESPNCVLLFEKLAQNSGIEDGLFELFASLDYSVYAVNGVNLREVDLAEFKAIGSYFVAGRRERVEDGGTDRSFFDIFPADLNILKGQVKEGSFEFGSADSRDGDLLFHGPYWYLPRGTYKLILDGEVNGTFSLDIAERFGFKVQGLEINSKQSEYEFVAYRDLIKFELVLRAKGNAGSLNLKKMRLKKIG